MSIVLDADVVLAWYDRGHDRHDEAVAWARAAAGPFVTTPLVLAVIDEQLGRDADPALREHLWRDLEVEAYTTRWWADALPETLRIARAHPHLPLATASLVALADRLRTTRIATFDPAFRSLTTSGGDPFLLLPQDTALAA